LAETKPTIFVVISKAHILLLVLRRLLLKQKSLVENLYDHIIHLKDYWVSLLWPLSIGFSERANSRYLASSDQEQIFVIERIDACLPASLTEDETDQVSDMCPVSSQWTESRNPIFQHVAEILLKCDKCLDGLQVTTVTHSMKVSVQTVNC
jgi:hypothetical protein